MRRQASGNNNDGISSTAVIIIVISVGVVGGYFLLLFLIVVTLVFCFVRFNCQWAKCKCDPKCSRKARLRCPKSVEDNICNCCGIMCKTCCPCCYHINECDNEELGFWIEIVLLGILCFPFALCCVILWAVSTSN